MDDQSPFPQPIEHEAPQAAPRKPRSARRLLATVTATALVAGVGGVGAGYAIGHAALGATSATTSGASRSNVASGGSGDIATIPGSGFAGGTWSEGGPGTLKVPTLPFDGTYGGPSTSPQSQSSDATTKASGSQLTGLVRIVSTLKYDGGVAAGTGMVLTSDGEVVTNHHVVAGSTSIKAKVMSTGRTYVAKVVGTDATDDVAVLRLVGASGLSTVTPDTDGIGVGDAVTAVGDANGTVNNLSAAKGRVMALRQAITTQSEGNASGERLTGLIQISSDVISGDSGGATYDSEGEVVGMTTAASSGPTDVVGYAVPIAKVLRIVDDLDSGVASSRYDYANPAFLGVALGDTQATVLGVYSGTPAATAGLAAGDRITAVGSIRVSSSAQLRRAVAAHSPGDSISVTWTDAGASSHTATVRLAEGPVE